MSNVEKYLMAQEPCLLGASDHLLYIGRKDDGNHPG
jgi:hypothetical protein